MKKLLLIASLTASAVAMQKEQSIHPKVQLSRMLAVKINFNTSAQAEEIRKDIKAAFDQKQYKPRFSDYSNHFWVWIDASENEIREQLKNKKWASQIKEIEGDCHAN